MRSAFTLLEMVLASAIGAMVIVVCLALLQSIERLERPLAVRQHELADLHRARTVIQRAMSSLVMSDTSPPVNVNARRTPDRIIDDGSGKSAFDATAEATANKQQQQSRPPARLLLEPDQTDELKAMLQQIGLPADSAGSIQRMEVVIDTPPIAPSFRAELGDVIAATYAQNKSTSGTTGSGTGVSGLSNSAARSSNSTSSSSRNSATSGASSGSSRGTARNSLLNAVQSGATTGNRNALALNGNSAAKSGSLRGAFEIRPMLTDSNIEARRDGKPVLYELWWNPLPAAKETTKTSILSANSTEASSQPADDPRTLQAWGEPVLLADNLVKCHWQLFSTGEKRSSHNAVWDRELPAYVEFEVQTKTGLYENWMFEIGWTKGPELVASADAPAAGGAVGIGNAGTGPQGGDGTATPENPQGTGAQGTREGGPRGPRTTPGQQPQQPPKPPRQPGSGPRYDTMPTGTPPK
ncbi:MAG: hypothetical protein KF805_15660 [Phycisphaeraceae bacterium]|nr:hypothetical protein [Phycisphaeraceae bacterium]